jgi:hypothetical protein
MKESHPAAIQASRMGGTVLLLLLLLGLSVRAGHKDDSSAEPRKNPKVVLSASPAFGFSPLNVQIVGTLTGVDSRDPNFCHAEITWIRVEPGSNPEKGSRLTEAPRCLHGESEISVATTFSKTFDLYVPGPYLYQLLITGKDGAQVRSNFVKVQVMRVP